MESKIVGTLVFECGVVNCRLPPVLERQRKNPNPEQRSDKRWTITQSRKLCRYRKEM